MTLHLFISIYLDTSSQTNSYTITFVIIYIELLLFDKIIQNVNIWVNNHIKQGKTQNPDFYLTHW